MEWWRFTSGQQRSTQRARGLRPARAAWRIAARKVRQLLGKDWGPKN
jgi:hypothetical protein